MACFVVPAAEAIVASIASKKIKSQAEISKVKNDKTEEIGQTSRIPFSRKLKWLTNLLWGGSALLAFEHFWHGEIVPWAPFLTAAGNKVDAAEMIREMATTGVCMAVVVTLVWGAMLLVTHFMEQDVMKEQAVERR